jgi:hypothetical protein
MSLLVRDASSFWGLSSAGTSGMLLSAGTFYFRSIASLFSAQWICIVIVFHDFIAILNVRDKGQNEDICNFQ